MAAAAPRRPRQCRSSKVNCAVIPADGEEANPGDSYEHLVPPNEEAPVGWRDDAIGGNQPELAAQRQFCRRQR